MDYVKRFLLDRAIINKDRSRIVRKSTLPAPYRFFDRRYSHPLLTRSSSVSRLSAHRGPRPREISMCTRLHDLPSTRPLPESKNEHFQSNMYARIRVIVRENIPQGLPSTRSTRIPRSGARDILLDPRSVRALTRYIGDMYVNPLILAKRDAIQTRAKNGNSSFSTDDYHSRVT